MIQLNDRAHIKSTEFISEENLQPYTEQYYTFDKNIDIQTGAIRGSRIKGDI